MLHCTPSGLTNGEGKAPYGVAQFGGNVQENRRRSTATGPLHGLGRASCCRAGRGCRDVVPPRTPPRPGQRGESDPHPFSATQPGRAAGRRRPPRPGYRPPTATTCQRRQPGDRFGRRKRQRTARGRIRARLGGRRTACNAKARGRRELLPRTPPQPSWISGAGHRGRHQIPKEGRGFGGGSSPPTSSYRQPEPSAASMRFADHQAPGADLRLAWLRRPPGRIHRFGTRRRPVPLVKLMRADIRAGRTAEWRRAAFAARRPQSLRHPGFISRPRPGCSAPPRTPCSAPHRRRAAANRRRGRETDLVGAEQGLARRRNSVTRRS